MVAFELADQFVYRGLVYFLLGLLRLARHVMS